MTRLTLRTPLSSAVTTAEELAKQVLTGRGINTETYLESLNLNHLTPPFSFKNIERACQRLIQALKNQEHIVLVTDHDCDGQTSCATLYWSLHKVFGHPASKISYFIGHRIEEGYGLSSTLCNRLLAAPLRPDLVITADCGSSDHTSVSTLSQLGIDVLITDHHTVPPHGPPGDALAVINPNQPGCAFPDKNIAGCFVAWFVMAATRFYWQKQEPDKRFPSLAPALDFVAIGTMADCVSLAESLNNRIVLRYGLRQIRHQKRSCWRALKKTFYEIIDSDFLIFKLIPLINADGRLGNALTGVAFLLSSDLITAQEKLAELIQCNEQRRFLQKKQIFHAQKLIQENSFDQMPGLIMNLREQGHAGIHGVTASRLLEQYQKMVILFSPSYEEGIIVGSARSPEDLSIKNLLDDLAQRQPELILRYGGHHQAAGLALTTDKFEAFCLAAQDYLREQSLPSHNNTEIVVDFFLADWSVVSFSFFSKFELLLEPFGKGFARPSFLVQATVVGGKAMGADKNHLQLDLEHPESGHSIKALLFFVDTAAEILDTVLGETLWLWGQFLLQEFQKERGVALFIQGFSHQKYYFDKKKRDIVKSRIIIPNLM